MDPEHRDAVKAIKELYDEGNMEEDDYKMCMKTALEEACARSRARKAEVERGQAAPAAGPTGPAAAAAAAAAGASGTVAAAALSGGTAAAEASGTAAAEPTALGGRWPHNTSTSSLTPTLVVNANLQRGTAIPVVMPLAGQSHTGPVRVGQVVGLGSSDIGV